MSAAGGYGSAQTCRVTCPDGNSMVVSCDTKVDPCPLRDLATTPALGTPEWRALVERFTDILNRLRAQDPLILRNQPHPVTYSDLRNQTGEMFDEAAYRLDSINLRNRWLVEQLQKLDREIHALLSSHDELLIRRTLLPSEKAAAQADFVRTKRAADAVRMPALSVQRAAEAMRYRAQRAAQDCIYWLAIAEPPGQVPISERTLATRVTAGQEPLIWTQIASESTVNISSTAPAQEMYTLAPTRRQLPGGSAADRLSAVEGLIPQLADGSELLYQNETAFAFRSTMVGPLRSKVSALMATVTRGHGELNRLRAETEGLKLTSSKDLQANQIRALGNLRRAAAEAFVLETFRDQVVIPEVRQFLVANRVNQNLDHAALVRIYSTKTSILPRRSGGSYVDVSRFVEVQNRTALVLADYRRFAAKASDQIAPSQARSIQAEVRRNLGRTRVDLLRGSEGESGPLAKIARALLRR